MFSKEKIVFIGAGSMTEAIISGLLTKKLVQPKQIWTTNHSNDERLRKLEKNYGINTTRDYEKLFTSSTIVILAMKPKDVENSLAKIQTYVTNKQLILSVIAGVSLHFIERNLNGKIPVIRAMPNTSATVGKSATGIALGTYSHNEHMHKAKTFFSSIGLVIVVHESEMHAVTGISGSGPAYLYYLAEALEESAIEHGLSEDVARQLIAQTFAGTANMLQHHDATPEELRKNVMSPGGTTEAGINALEKYGFKKAMQACVKAAVKRSHDLEALYKQK
ncbi:pyrroline-5-carboxylate reductase [Pueribacillus sp. YX66]|uniref:pyrroline-5-carboxylate reductase n=1 Tax=Pueribacillus sp. YX66 TaxID=3229242 RepID=UPI00358D5FCA